MLTPDTINQGLVFDINDAKTEWNNRRLSPNSKTAVSLQGKFLYSKYSWFLDDQFAVLKTALDKLLADIILILT